MQGKEVSKLRAQLHILETENTIFSIRQLLTFCFSVLYILFFREKKAYFKTILTWLQGVNLLSYDFKFFNLWGAVGEKVCMQALKISN